MEEISGWEMLLGGAIVLGVLIWAGPGVKAMLEQSRNAEHRDWTGFLIPIIIVILFVYFLISLV